MKIRIRGLKGELILADEGMTFTSAIPVKVRVKGIKGEPIFEEMPFDLLTVLFRSYEQLFQGLFDLNNTSWVDADTISGQKTIYLHPSVQKTYTPLLTFTTEIENLGSIEGQSIYAPASVLLKVKAINPYKKQKWGEVRQGNTVVADLNLQGNLLTAFPDILSPNLEYTNQPVQFEIIVEGATGRKRKIYNVQVYYKSSTPSPEYWVNQYIYFFLECTPDNISPIWADYLRIRVYKTSGTWRQIDTGIQQATRRIQMNTYLYSDNENLNSGVYNSYWEVEYTWSYKGKTWTRKVPFRVKHHERIYSTPTNETLTLRDIGNTRVINVYPEAGYPQWWNIPSNPIASVQITYSSDPVPEYTISNNFTVNFRFNSGNTDYASITKNFSYQATVKKWAVFKPDASVPPDAYLIPTWTNYYPKFTILQKDGYYHFVSESQLFNTSIPVPQSYSFTAIRTPLKKGDIGVLDQKIGCNFNYDFPFIATSILFLTNALEVHFTTDGTVKKFTIDPYSTYNVRVDEIYTGTLGGAKYIPYYDLNNNLIGSFPLIWFTVKENDLSTSQYQYSTYFFLIKNNTVWWSRILEGTYDGETPLGYIYRIKETLLFGNTVIELYGAKWNINPPFIPPYYKVLAPFILVNGLVPFVYQFRPVHPDWRIHPYSPPSGFSSPPASTMRDGFLFCSANMYYDGYNVEGHGIKEENDRVYVMLANDPQNRIVLVPKTTYAVVINIGKKINDPYNYDFLDLYPQGTKGDTYLPSIQQSDTGITALLNSTTVQNADPSYSSTITVNYIFP